MVTMSRSVPRTRGCRGSRRWRRAYLFPEEQSRNTLSPLAGRWPCKACQVSAPWPLSGRHQRSVIEHDPEVKETRRGRETPRYLLYWALEREARAARAVIQPARDRPASHIPRRAWDTWSSLPRGRDPEPPEPGAYTSRTGTYRGGTTCGGGKKDGKCQNAEVASETQATYTCSL